MRAIFASTIFALSATLATSALAQFSKPERAIAYRRSVMTVVGTHFYAMGAMANGRVPFDAKVVAENGALVETLIKLPWQAFGPGTDVGAKTLAQPEIWREPTKFKDAQEKMMAEIVKFNATVKAGTIESLKTAYSGADAACKGCHDKYRSD